MVYCEATIKEPALRDNLRQCIKILGGEPYVHQDVVSVTATKNESRMIALFEQFELHSVQIKHS